MADIAVSPPRQTATTMATGPRRRSWNSRGRSRREPHRRHQAPCEVRPAGFFPVLEIDEHVRQTSKLTNRLRPPFDIRLLIALVPQTEVTVTGGDLHW